LYLLHWEGAAEEKQLTSSQSTVSQTKAHTSDGYCRRQFDYKTSPCVSRQFRLMDLCPGIVRTVRASETFERVEALIQWNAHIAWQGFPPPVCLDGCWRGESDCCAGSRKVDHLYGNGSLGSSLGVFRPAPDARRYLSLRAIFRIPPGPRRFT